MRLIAAAVVLALLLLPGAVCAEVSDKAATVPELWFQHLVLGLVAFLAGRFRFWLGLVLLPASLLLAYGGLGMLLDDRVGPALVAEQGLAMVFAVYAGVAVMLLLHGAGLYLGWRRGNAPGWLRHSDRARPPAEPSQPSTEKPDANVGDRS